jgi:hypothetical protein
MAGVTPRDVMAAFDAGRAAAGYAPYGKFWGRKTAAQATRLIEILGDELLPLVARYCASRRPYVVEARHSWDLFVLQVKDMRSAAVEDELCPRCQGWPIPCERCADTGRVPYRALAIEVDDDYAAMRVECRALHGDACHTFREHAQRLLLDTSDTALLR